MSYFVYVHTFPDGRKYVGLTTTSPKKRWKGGMGYKEHPILFSEIVKQGWNNVAHKLYEVDTKSEMEYLESYLISYYNTNDIKCGFNRTSGGTSNYVNAGVKNYWSSDENRKKQGTLMRAYWTPERKKEHSEKMKIIHKRKHIEN